MGRWAVLGIRWAVFGGSGDGGRLTVWRAAVFGAAVAVLKVSRVAVGGWSGGGGVGVGWR